MNASFQKPHRNVSNSGLPPLGKRDIGTIPIPITSGLSGPEKTKNLRQKTAVTDLLSSFPFREGVRACAEPVEVGGSSLSNGLG